MAWSYSGDPGADDKDFVRYKSGDTDQLDPLVSDEEIAYELLQTDSPLKAAYNTVRAILKKLARRVNKKLGPARLDLEKQFEHYQQIKLELQEEIQENGLAVPCQSDDIHTTRFDIGMMDNDQGPY